MMKKNKHKIFIAHAPSLSLFVYCVPFSFLTPYTQLQINYYQYKRTCTRTHKHTFIPISFSFCLLLSIFFEFFLSCATVATTATAYFTAKL